DLVPLVPPCRFLALTLSFLAYAGKCPVHRICACQVRNHRHRVTGFGVVLGVGFFGGPPRLGWRKNSVLRSRKTLSRTCLRLPCIDSEFPCVPSDRPRGTRTRVVE